MQISKYVACVVPLKFTGCLIIFDSLSAFMFFRLQNPRSILNTSSTICLVSIVVFTADIRGISCKLLTDKNFILRFYYFTGPVSMFIFMASWIRCNFIIDLVRKFSKGIFICICYSITISHFCGRKIKFLAKYIFMFDIKIVNTKRNTSFPREQISDFFIVHV